MKKALIIGINGRMGKMLCASASDYGYTVVGGVDKEPCGGDIPVFNDVDKIDVQFDVIIDFSNPYLLSPIIALEQRVKSPSCLQQQATTTAR